MRSDIKELTTRSAAIRSKEKNFPKKNRKAGVRDWLEEIEWDSFKLSDDLEDELSFLSKVAISKEIVRQIIQYGYAWLPNSLKKTGKRIAIITPTLMTLNMLCRLSLIPMLFASDLPPSPYFSFALHVLITALVHELEVRMLKKTPVVMNSYVSALSIFTNPRLASLAFRLPNLLLHGTFLFRPEEVFFISADNIDRALAAYYYYVSLWFLVMEGFGSLVIYQLYDRKKPELDLSWDDERS